MLARGGECACGIWDATGGVGMVRARGCWRERLRMHLGATRGVERRQWGCDALGHDEVCLGVLRCDGGRSVHGGGWGVVPMGWEGARWSWCASRPLEGAPVS